jgi:hypothetical protein
MRRRPGGEPAAPEAGDEAPDATPDLFRVLADRERFYRRFVLSLILAPPPGRRRRPR